MIDDQNSGSVFWPNITRWEIYTIRKTGENATPNYAQSIGHFYLLTQQPHKDTQKMMESMFQCKSPKMSHQVC